MVIFLLQVRSSLAILPTLPLSLAMSFIAMYLLAVDSNIKSLGLTLPKSDPYLSVTVLRESRRWWAG